MALRLAPDPGAAARDPRCPDPDEIHLWRVHLGEVEAASVWPLLAPDEQGRAGRFRRVGDRERFVVARGVLRLLLGRYLGRSPASLAFADGPHGKPALVASPTHRFDCRFNLAHAGAFVLYAIANGREVGVDLEAVRPVPDLALLATTALSPPEHATFLTLPPARQPDAFFTAWVRKEAYVKAIGLGLGRPFTGLTVVPVGDGLAHVADVHVAGEQSAPVVIRDLAPAAGYVGAVAAVGDWYLPARQWPGLANLRDAR